MDMPVEKFVVDFIEQKGSLPDGVDLDSFDYIASGYVDSMRLMRFIIDLESRFGIEIDDAEIESPRFRTIAGVIGIVSEKVDNRGKSAMGVGS